jgi:plastocyanin
MSRRSILVLGCAAALAIAACSGAGGGSGAPGTASIAPDAGRGYGYGDAVTPSASVAANGACSATTEAATVDVGMDGRAFTTSTIAAKVGDVIAFTNSDSVPHTATLDDGSCTTENLGSGETGALTFTAAGTYPFHCKIHPDMTGTFEITS